MAIYKPKVKKTTSTLDEVKFPSSVIDGLDKIAVRYVGDTSKLKTTGVYSVALERDGNDIKSSSYDNYDDVDSILIVGKNNDGDYFQMMFFDGKVYYRKTGESSNFPYYWSEGISLLEGGGSGGGTTYTFASGTTNGAFQVTLSGGSAQSVPIHGLKTAAYRDVTDSSSNIYSNSGSIVSGGAVYSYLNTHIVGNYIDLTSSQDITGVKNFKNGLLINGKDVSAYYPYSRFLTTKSYTATAKGTISIQLSNIIPSDEYVSGEIYELYGQILAYSPGTGEVYLYSDQWGDTSSTSYYLINTTSNARVGSTAFVIPCTSTLTCYKNINFSEFSLRIYGYRRISR